MFLEYHDSRVNRQFQRDGTNGADIAVLQTLHNYGHWKREGRLLPYKPLKWEYIYSSLRTPKALSLEPSPVNNPIPTAHVVIEHVTNKPCNKTRPIRQLCLQQRITQGFRSPFDIRRTPEPLLEKQTRPRPA
jgi:hypothetical protein